MVDYLIRTTHKDGYSHDFVTNTREDAGIYSWGIIEVVKELSDDEVRQYWEITDTLIKNFVKSLPEAE